MDSPSLAKMDGSRKRERDYETGDAAIADFAKSLDNDARAGSKAPGTVAYLPCKTFSGLREGYYFKLGPQGPGYYIDKVARVKAAMRTAIAAADSAGAGSGGAGGSGGGMGGPGSMLPPPRRAAKMNAEELLAEAGPYITITLVLSVRVTEASLGIQWGNASGFRDNRLKGVCQSLCEGLMRYQV